MRFWDSSAVVPLLVQQPTSARADRWLADDPAVALWTLTPVEITSALWRLVRDGTVLEADAQRGESRAQELATASYTVADVEAVKAFARRLLRVHALRAADALQLGAALVWRAAVRKRRPCTPWTTGSAPPPVAKGSTFPGTLTVRQASPFCGGAPQRVVHLIHRE